MKHELPYKECATCEVLDDCPCPDVSEIGLSLPMPPDVCPKPIEVMKMTREKHKLKKRRTDD